MNIFGVIRREPDPPGIDKGKWIELIGSHPNLRPGEPATGTNPFTRKPMTVHAAPDIARVMIDGKRVGTMAWSCSDENNLINVDGEISLVGPVAQQIAELLNGRFDLVQG